MSTFGLTLRELRQKHGMTQEQLAERAGIERTTLAKLETDTNAPMWSTVLALANALGEPVTKFPDVAPGLKRPKAGAGRTAKKGAADGPETPARKKGKAKGG